MFKEATKEQTRLRLCLCGPAGAGKTFTGLRFAFQLAKERDCGRGGVAVIDTEHHSASKYRGESPDGIPWNFAVEDLEYHSPDNYRMAIEEAGRMGFDVLLIDSLTHAWAGVGGALAQIDANPSANRFTAWKDVTPQHNALIDTILRSPCHVIGTMRSKMEHVLEVDERGKNVPRKIGMKPIQREGMEYEFDIVCDMDVDHYLTVSKSRCSRVDGVKVYKPSGSFLNPVYEWLMSGSPPPAPAPASVPPEANGGGILLAGPPIVRAEADPIMIQEIKDAAKSLGWTPEKFREVLARAGASRVAELPMEHAATLRNALHAKVAEEQAKEAF